MITVVIADDHPLVLQALTQLLEAADDIAVVTAAADGQQALDAVTEHSPDVVLMDVEMPQMNGIAATRRCSQQL